MSLAYPLHSEWSLAINTQTLICVVENILRAISLSCWWQRPADCTLSLVSLLNEGKALQTETLVWFTGPAKSYGTHIDINPPETI